MKNVTTLPSNILRRLPRFLNLRFLFALAMLMLFMAAGALLAMRVLSDDPPQQMLPLQDMAREMSAHIGRESSVQFSSGAYVPAKGLVLYTKVDIEDEDSMRIWAVNQLRIQENQFSRAVEDVSLIWIVDYGVDRVRQSVLTVPLGQAADIRAHRYTSLPSFDEPASVDKATDMMAAPAPLQVAGASAGEESEQEQTQAGAPTSEPLAVDAAPEVTTSVATGPAATGVSIVDTFDADIQQWLPLAGAWSIDNGLYAQTNPDGYDFISMLQSEPVTDFSLRTRFRHVTGNLGAGLIYDAPQADVRGGAKLIDLVDEGKFLRWGGYTAEGTYEYVGGVVLEPPIADDEWHVLQIVARDDAVTILLDDSQVAVVEGRVGGGYVGLLTSQSQVEFDDLALTPADAEQSGLSAAVQAANPVDVMPQANPITAPASVAPLPLAQADGAQEEQPLAILPLPLSGFADTFDAGAAASWQVIAGDWTAIDSEYRQTAEREMDYLVVSPFRGSQYTVMVDLRAIDGGLGGGIAFNLADPNVMASGQIVRFRKDEDRLEWGRIDESGTILIDDRSPQLALGDDGWQALRLDVADASMQITLGDDTVAKDVPLTWDEGYVGLYSQGAAAFDNVTMETRTEE